MTVKDVPKREKGGEGRFDLVLVDPPWPYYGSGHKAGAAGKHYPLMTLGALKRLSVPRLLAPNAVLLLWATGPRLHFATELLTAWRLHYRGVLYVWVKTRRDGRIIAGQGVIPTFTKPTTEFLLAATTKPTGRPLPVRTYRQGQVVLAPRGCHSQKPAVVYDLLEELFGSRLRRIEIFARRAQDGWTALGNEIDHCDIRQSLRALMRERHRQLQISENKNYKTKLYKRKTTAASSF